MEEKNVQILKIADAETKQFSGNKNFHTFINTDGKELLFKNTRFGLCALSELFHSKLAIILGQPAAVNKLAVEIQDNYLKLGGIASENFIDSKNQTLIDIADAYPSEIYTRTFYETNSFYFANLNLETFTAVVAKKYPDLLPDFIRTWLTSNLFAPVDQKYGRNISFIDTKNSNGIINRKMAPSYDFEGCLFFVEYLLNTEENIPDKYKKLVSSGISYLGQGISQNNMAFLKKNYSYILDEYFDNLLKLKNSSEFSDLCDFTGLEKFINENNFKHNMHMTEKQLSKLSQNVYDGYKNKIDQFINAKGLE